MLALKTPGRKAFNSSLVLLELGLVINIYFYFEVIYFECMGGGEHFKIYHGLRGWLLGSVKYVMC